MHFFGKSEAKSPKNFYFSGQKHRAFPAPRCVFSQGGPADRSAGRTGRLRSAAPGVLKAWLTHGSRQAWPALSSAGLSPPGKTKPRPMTTRFPCQSLALALKARAPVDVDQYFVFADPAVGDHPAALGVWPDLHQPLVLAAPGTGQPAITYRYHFTMFGRTLQGVPLLFP